MRHRTSTPQILPSVMAADFTRLGEQLQTLAEAGVEVFHVDVMDGQFVPNITFGPLLVEAMRRSTSAKLDVHLMIVEPERYIPMFAHAGADWISIHWEATPNLYRALQMIREHGCRPGIAINPQTPARVLRDIMPIVEYLNVMTVNPGFGGQQFISEMMPKVARLRAMVNEMRREMDIQVDGGINAETAQAAMQAGANLLVAGTALFGHAEGAVAGYQALKDSLTSER